MIDFYKFFETQTESYFFTFNFRKKTYGILKFFLEKLLQNYNQEITISSSDLYKNIKLPEYSTFEEYLDELLSLKIKIKRYSSLNSVSIHCYNIIDSYYFTDTNLNVNFSNNFINLLRNNFIFSEFSMDSILLLMNKYYIKLFIYLISSFKYSSYTEITISDLKVLLNLDDKYSRDNDFINKVIILALKEINQILYFKINFEKVKITKRNYKILFKKTFTLDNNDLNSLAMLLDKFSPHILYSRYTKMKFLAYTKNNGIQELINYFDGVNNIKIFSEKLKTISIHNLNLTPLQFENKNIVINKTIFIPKNNKNYFVTWVINELLKQDITSNFSDISMKLLKNMLSNKHEFIENNFKVTCFIEKEMGYLKIEKL